MNTSDQPTFSVVIPTCNRAHLLPRAIRSVLHQTFEDFELLIVDDNSGDETSKIVKSFQDKRIIYIRHEENRGGAAARNSGILQAKGKYISFLDDDDEYLPPFLAETGRVFQSASKQVGFTWCGVRWVRDTPSGETFLKEQTWQMGSDDSQEAYLSWLRSTGIGIGYGLTIRRTCFKVVGLLDETLPVAHDADFLLRLTSTFASVPIPAVLIICHQHTAVQLTDARYLGRRAEAYQQIIQKNRQILNRDPYLWQMFYRRTANYYYQWGKNRQGRQYLFRMIMKYPCHLPNWLNLISFELCGVPAATCIKKMLPGNIGYNLVNRYITWARKRIKPVSLHR